MITLFQQTGKYFLMLLEKINIVKNVLLEIRTLKYEEYKSICLLAIKTDISALRLVLDDNIKSFIINQITPRKDIIR